MKSELIVPGGPRQMRLVAVASALGQVIEYYDFLLYGSAAALVFGPLFFPSADSRASTAAAFASFAVGFLLRPVGAVVFGHLGDRIGRRSTLLVTLLVMGVATTLIGLLPTYAHVGIAAPIALVVLRCIQGLSVGGEWGGAALLAVEHSPGDRRAVWGSLPQLGSPLGLLLSTLALLAVSRLSDRQFLTWGWRVPFLFTSVLVIAGVIARHVVAESPEFAAPARHTHAAVPLRTVLSSYRRPLLGGVLLATVTTAGYYIVSTFTVAYVVDQLALPRSVGLVGLLLTATVQLALVPVAGTWALRRNPHRMAAVAALLTALWGFPLFALVQTGVPLAVWTAQAVAAAFLTVVWALLPVILADQFPASCRYTAISLSLQLAGVLGGLAPLAATRLLSGAGGVPWLVAALLCAVGGASAVGAVICLRGAPRTPPGIGQPAIPAQRSVTAEESV